MDQLRGFSYVCDAIPPVVPEPISETELERDWDLGQWRPLQHMQPENLHEWDPFQHMAAQDAIDWHTFQHLQSHDFAEWEAFQLQHAQQRAIEEKNQCSVCSKTYATAKALREHAVVHSNERPFRCDVCDKAFKYQSNLFEHRTLHYPKKVHFCPQCGKQIRLRGNLKKHLATHIREKDILEREWAKYRASEAAYDRKQKRKDSKATQQEPPIIETVPNISQISLRGAQQRHGGKGKRKLCSADYWVDLIEQNALFPRPPLEMLCRMTSERLREAHRKGEDIAEVGKEIPFEMYCCPVCTRSFIDRESCFNHAVTTHCSVFVKGKRRFYCGTCVKFFNTKEEKELHDVIHDRVRRLQEEGDVIFEAPPLFIPHLAVEEHRNVDMTPVTPRSLFGMNNSYNILLVLLFGVVLLNIVLAVIYFIYSRVTQDQDDLDRQQAINDHILDVFADTTIPELPPPAPARPTYQPPTYDEVFSQGPPSWCARTALTPTVTDSLPTVSSFTVCESVDPSARKLSLKAVFPKKFKSVEPSRTSALVSSRNASIQNSSNNIQNKAGNGALTVQEESTQKSSEHREVTAPTQANTKKASSIQPMDLTEVDTPMSICAYSILSEASMTSSSAV
ncbi:hypothetical protein QR680_004507 [Steinernema hermaphroditum]|uniref:C2H2-type domain-containing protein n=1 Tax=Steinernema hermaphroditum TaxID=289476 RepID=A0AA39LU39_9BILA|nr:hypothetical protein QR680_004507 [Steinernema hermaphroditum]